MIVIFNDKRKLIETLSDNIKCKMLVIVPQIIDIDRTIDELIKIDLPITTIISNNRYSKTVNRILFVSAQIPSDYIRGMRHANIIIYEKDVMNEEFVDGVIAGFVATQYHPV